VGTHIRNVLQQLSLAFLLDVLFLVQEHRVKASFHTGFYEELAVKVEVRLFLVFLRSKVIVISKCFVYVFYAVGFSTEDFIAMFNSRNPNLFLQINLLHKLLLILILQLS
jgi:hypothetical protein